MARRVRSLWKSTEGGIAPTIALSLFALIAAGGIAFDYAHMAALDTELQDAADQAALAAATQLDGKSGSMQAAAAVAQSLLANRTLFANDNGGTGVSVAGVVFYATRDDAEAGANGFTNTGNFKNAHFVRVSIAARRAYFALTPVVGALSSGDISAQAVAGLKSAICRIPPLMMCNPSETPSNKDFDPTAYVGKGIKLVAVGNGGGTWAPGDFGYLQNNNGVGGAPGLRQLLGWNIPPGDCLDIDNGDTKPGANTTVTDAVNTRFDILQNGPSCPSGGSCPASIDSVKDVIRSPDSPDCAYGRGTNDTNWHLPPTYYGNKNMTISATTPLPTSTTPASMGHPRDMCHAVSNNGSCANGRIGDGLWDRDAYFRTNYRRSDGTYWTGGNGAGSWQANTGLSPTVAATSANYASRYNVYAWEIAHAGQSVDGVTVLGPRAIPSQAGNNAYGEPVCSPYGTQIPGPNTPDRRRLTIAVVNCSANNVHGSSTDVPILEWIDAFLVEPSINRWRTSAADIYVEVIGATTGVTPGSTGGQLTRRDVPYLVK